MCTHDTTTRTLPGSHTLRRGAIRTHGGVNDMQAVSAYRKTFASSRMCSTRRPIRRAQMLLHMEQIGCDTAVRPLDRRSRGVPFGLAGVCCKNCNMGPCKITAKSARGVCGADL